MMSFARSILLFVGLIVARFDLNLTLTSNDYSCCRNTNLKLLTKSNHSAWGMWSAAATFKTIVSRPRPRTFNAKPKDWIVKDEAKAKAWTLEPKYTKSWPRGLSRPRPGLRTPSLVQSC